MLKRLALIVLYSLLMAASLQESSSALADKLTEDSSTVYLPLVQSSTSGVPTTEWIGPGGGQITDLLFDPVNHDTAFAAASIGGIYKSTDGGLNWRNVSQGIENLEVTALGIATKNPLVMYAGTYRSGLYKSVNNGESWFSSDDGIQDLAITYAIEIDPTRTKTVYVSTRGESTDHHAPWNGVIYKSVDGGATWNEVLTNVGGSTEEDWAYDLAIHPTSTEVVFAATHEHGAYRSEDQGSSWATINIGVTDSTARAIEHDPDSAYKGEAYLGVFERTGVFKSYSGGDSWTLQDDGLNGARIYKLTIDPDNTDLIYLATYDDGVMRSTNGGSTWNSSGLDDEIIMDVVVKPGEHEVLLSGTLENGIFRSTNSGVSWTHSMQGLNASTVPSLIIRPDNSQDLIAALTPGWIARSTDGGMTWSDYHSGITDKYVNLLVTHPTLPNMVYALTETGGLYLRDTDGWENWIDLHIDLPDTVLTSVNSQPETEDEGNNLEDFLFPKGIPSFLQQKALSSTPALRAMVFAPTDPQTAYLGTDGSGVYKSIDDGDSWVYSGLTGWEIRDLFVSPTDPTWIYAATNSEGSVYRSPNGGNDWENLMLTGVTAYALAIHPSNPDLVYVGTSNGVFQHNGSWSAVGLEGFQVYDIAIHPNNPNILYAGTNNSALVSLDGGNNWEVVSEELLGIRIKSIDFDPNDPDVVFISTQGHGIMRVES